MNDEIARLWRQKADNDFKAGNDELATQNPATDTVCFHMQQCVEKNLKSFLVLHGKEISKTHNIAFLVQQCMEIDNSFELLKAKNIAILTAYAVDLRYPDNFYMPTVQESYIAIGIAAEVRDFVRDKFST